jgi:NTP pyrophosphatase (non-canonical NTP hydrolase)
VGKIAAVFEALDHSRDVGEAGKSEPITPEQVQTLRAMSADLLTAALRFANLYGFDLAEALIERVKEKNGVDL